MNRTLLTSRWLLLHLMFLVAVVTTGVLSWWQWDRAHEAGGSFQNLGYALQWPLFGLFTLFFWYRLASMDTKPASSVQEPPPVSAPEQTRRRPLVPPPASRVSEDEDPELAAYNRYLADLDKADGAELPRST